MRIISLLAAATLLALPGCSKPATDAAGTAPAAAQSDQSIADAVVNDGQFKTLAAGLKSTGLDGVFAGKGGYTLLAPTDAAFSALGDKGAALTAPDQQALLAAVLRGHVMPGAITLEDLGKAIDANGGKPVKMRTMGSGSVSFARQGAEMTVTADDGSTAKLSGGGLVATNGEVLPINGVLKKF